MIESYRRALHLYRDSGIDIHVIPGPGPVTGIAWSVPAADSASGKISLHINIKGSTHSPLWLFVLLHEVAHHILGHTIRRDSSPLWIKEYQTDRLALKWLAKWQPAALPQAEAASKRHIRPLLQAMIDGEIWHHVDRDISVWAGCHMPDDVFADDAIWDAR
jgi:hypothetical protein